MSRARLFSKLIDNLGDIKLGYLDLADDVIVMAHSAITYVLDDTVLTYNFTYKTNNISVYLNRALLRPSEYTATNGTSITFSVTLNLDDEIEIITPA